MPTTIFTVAKVNSEQIECVNHRDNDVITRGNDVLSGPKPLCQYEREL